MGKRYDHLWHEVTAFSNLLTAYRRAAAGKRGRPAVVAFTFDLEGELLRLQAELQAGVYQPGVYVNFTVHEHKRRLISAAPFRDRVVHHALCNVIEPLFERQFIHDTYANRVGKGTHRALDRCTEFMRRFTYVLPLDVRQFFPAIDHVILQEILGRTLGDERVLDLAGKIIASGVGVQADEYEMVYFPGDDPSTGSGCDLFAIQRPRGLPIGNLTSQFWANVYLNGLDHFAKRELKCRGYVRYVDDVLLFADDKATLHGWHSAVITYLAGLRLTIHANSAQPRPCRVGLPFLGFQVFPDHRRLKRRNVIHARRRLKTLRESYRRGEIPLARVNASVQSWISHASHGNTWGLRRALLHDFRLTRGGHDQPRAARGRVADLQQEL